MTDKELADALVGDGIITKDPFRHDMYSMASTDGQFVGVRYDANEIVSDPRVAMAVMEKSIMVQCLQHPDGYWMVDVSTTDLKGQSGTAENTSLPRAICEAYVASLE